MLKNKLKFVICSSHRTGSEMLRKSLSHHSQIKVAGEVFIYPEKIPFRNNPGEMLDLIFKHFHGFKQHRWVKLPSSYAHKQCKWEYSRCLQVWAAIAQQQDIKIIDIKRRNLLAVITSHKLAEKTNIWSVGKRVPHLPSLSDSATIDDVTNRAIRKPTVSFNPKQIADLLSEKEHQYEMASTLLSDHKQMEVYYEDMVANPAEIFTSVQTFLGLPVEPLPVVTYKQERRPLSEVIENFHQLKEFFRGTKHYNYFL